MTFTQGRWDDSDRDQLLVTLTPTEDGEVHLLGVDVTYAMDSRSLWRRGTETLRTDVKVRAR